MAPAAWRPGTRQIKHELMQLLKLMYMIASFENFPRAISARDRIINLDIPQGLAIDKDIVDIYRIRRLTLYFGNVIRMAPYRHPHISLHGIYMDSVQEEDHGRSGWTISVKTAQRWTCPLFKHHVLPGTGLNRGPLFTTRAANARRRHRPRRLGIKSSKSSQCTKNAPAAIELLQTPVTHCSVDGCIRATSYRDRHFGICCR